MSISSLNSIYGKQPHHQGLPGVGAAKRAEEEGGSLTERTMEENPLRQEDSVEISAEGRLAARQDQSAQKTRETTAGQETEEAEELSERQGGKVGVNESKRARQLAAAQNRSQVQQVLALLEGDLSDCKAGLEKGWCDEAEIAKVEALISRAKARMSQVPQKSGGDQGGIDAFTMASLM